MKETRESQLRRWVGGQLKQSGCRVPPPVWTRLSEERFVDECLDDENAETRQSLLKFARAYLADHRAAERRVRIRKKRRSPGARLPAPEEITGSVDLSRCLDPGEVKRAELLTREVARISERMSFPETIPDDYAGQPVVSHFRGKYLDGQVLSEDAARKFLRSPALHFFELGFFRSHGIPLAEHQSEVISPPDYTEPEHSLFGHTRLTDVEVRWNGGSLVERIGKRARLGFRSSEVGEGLILQVCPGSVLDDLSTYAQYLSLRFPWAVHEAAHLILAGTIPTVRAISFGPPKVTQGPEHGLVRIEMTFQPWLSLASLTRIHKALQTFLLKKRNRPPTKESLEFYDFVSEQRYRGASWFETMKAWTGNSRKRRKQYPRGNKNSVRRFVSNYRDVERQILQPFANAASVKAKQEATRPKGRNHPGMAEPFRPSAPHS